MGFIKPYTALGKHICKYILFAIILLSYRGVLNAQTKQIDSLTSAINKGKDDTVKLNNLNTLTIKLYEINKYDHADSIANCAIQLAQKIDCKPGLGVAYAGKGTIYCMQGRYVEGLKYYAQALSIEEEAGYKDGIGRTHGNIGVAYYQQGKFPEALKEELIALELMEKTGNKLSIADQCGNIGNIYSQMNDFGNALKMFNHSLELYTEINNKAGIAMSYGNLGNVYQDEYHDTDAIHSQQKALAINIEIHNSEGIGDAYANIGAIRYGEGNHSEAYKDELLAMKEFHKVNDADAMGNVTEIIASNFIKEKRFGEAKQYLDSSLAFTKITGAKTAIRDVYFDFSTLDSASGNFKQALVDYERFIKCRDDISNEANTKKLVTEQLNYEFDKKVAAQKSDQEKKDAIAAISKKKQVILTIAISLVLLVVIVFSGLLLSRFRVTQRQKAIIEHQKQLVEEKNKDILDSITYAKHLQDAILPPMQVIKKHLPEIFILYKPKDIVAGDFYWFEKAPLNLPKGETMNNIPPLEGGEALFVAACDCTGHGVPGAMVSVVCSNALNRAVKEFKITEPGKILDKTRELVLETFEKSEGDIKDGMDVSLAAISYQPLAISWSGAYNSLWYMQDGQMHELEPDKQPIGKTDNPKPFTTHTIKLNPPKEGGEAATVLYLFTDGYADQFGGPKGKKFKYKQLQEKLVAISHKPMVEQKQELENTFESWKGNLEQVDDVLIMGIRV